jgi:hypothetical protein
MTPARPSQFENDPGTLERRLGPRRRVFLAGRALIDGSRVVEVTFRDISEFRARVIWNQAPMFGVAFDEAIDLRSSRPVSCEPLAASWDAWRTAPQSADD